MEGNAPQSSFSRAAASHVDWRARAISMLKSMHQARAPSVVSVTTQPADEDPNTVRSDASATINAPLPVADLVELQLWKQTSLSKRFRQLEQDANDVMHAIVCDYDFHTFSAFHKCQFVGCAGIQKQSHELWVG